MFSANPFPGSMVEFEWRCEESGGNWYYCAALEREGWLCATLVSGDVCHLWRSSSVLKLRHETVQPGRQLPIG